MSGPPDSTPDGEAPAWHGQWLQTAAECLDVSPRALTVARTSR